MRTKLTVLLASICLTGAANAQQVEYVTRGTTGGHAIRFGSTPIRATLPQAYIRVNNAPHTVTAAAEAATTRGRTVYGKSRDRDHGRHSHANRIGLRVRFVKIHGTNHVIPTFAVDTDNKPMRANRGSRGERDRAQPTGRDQRERPEATRHALMIHALMNNKLDCHR